MNSYWTIVYSAVCGAVWMCGFSIIAAIAYILVQTSSPHQLFAQSSGKSTSAGIASPEVGEVAWRRDYENALVESKNTGKPIFLFFQEVPGCSGCQKFGTTVLSEPLMIEAIESLFIPVLVFNNKGGKDREVLEYYREPAWNYQVIRFIDGDRRDIIPRADRVWTIPALATRMSAALMKTGRQVPPYLQGLTLPSDPQSLREAYFEMACFWTGEMKLGSLPSVLATEAGFLRGREVVKVVYDKEKTPLSTLIRQASTHQCASKVYSQEAVTTVAYSLPHLKLASSEVFTSAPHRDQKKQIGGTIVEVLLPSMPQFQVTKVNAFVRTDLARALSFLSPRQRAQLQRS